MSNVERAANSFLLDGNTSKLPINVLEFRVSKFRWVITPYSKVLKSGLINRELLEYSRSHNGFTMTLKDGKFIIVYKDELSDFERTILIIHEFGHIALRHGSANGVLGKSNDPSTEDKQEEEANLFVNAFLAPICILSNNNWLDPHTISKHTLIAKNEAEQVSAKIQEHRRFEQSELEKKLSKKFKTKRYIRRLLVFYSLISLCVIIFIAAFWQIQLNHYNPPIVTQQSPEEVHRKPEASEPPEPSTVNELTLINITSPIGRNKSATVSIKGIPNTEYDIYVHYPSGISKADGLTRKTSDADGNISWSWKIGGQTTKGTHYLEVIGGSKTLRVDFVVE